MGRIAKRIGFVLASAHIALFVLTIVYTHFSSDGQAPLIWLVWAIADFPISLLYWAVAEPYSSWLNLMRGQPVIQALLYLPYVTHGLLGAIWWYWLPRLIMPAKYGGLWRRKARTN